MSTSNNPKQSYLVAPLSRFEFHPKVKGLPLLTDVATWARERNKLKDKGGRHEEFAEDEIEQAGQWSFFKQDFAARGQRDLVCCVAKGDRLLIVNGRQRYTSAKENKEKELRYFLITEEEVDAEIIGSELARKHLKKEAVAYTALHINRHLLDVKPGPKRPSETELAQSLRELALRIGVSPRTLTNAKQFMLECDSDLINGPERVLQLFAGKTIKGIESGIRGKNSGSDDEPNGSKRKQLVQKWTDYLKTSTKTLKRDGSKLDTINDAEFLATTNEFLKAHTPRMRQLAKILWAKEEEEES